MQTITDRTEELARELAIRTRVAMSDLVHAVSERSREQRGQTAAEYMGILLIVAMIIGAHLRPEAARGHRERRAGLRRQHQERRQAQVGADRRLRN